MAKGLRFYPFLFDFLGHRALAHRISPAFMAGSLLAEEPLRLLRCRAVLRTATRLGFHVRTSSYWSS